MDENPLSNARGENNQTIEDLHSSGKNSQPSRQEKVGKVCFAVHIKPATAHIISLVAWAKLLCLPNANNEELVSMVLTRLLYQREALQPSMRIVHHPRDVSDVVRNACKVPRCCGLEEMYGDDTFHEDAARASSGLLLDTGPTLMHLIELVSNREIPHVTQSHKQKWRRVPPLHPPLPNSSLSEDELDFLLPKAHRCHLPANGEV
ncbi:hypothetical protein OS493_027364 [Desmophyllum pertusum]|uniref:Uncharacterized protein n=1 Tax=Desmophyllum pertusum TaxID=174260 RepID=A0A9X0CPU4_9CNID|nr:hypothetical protein OS493_027364 [Desmophyllum pertusum]